MHAFRDWFERRLARHVAWAGVSTLVLSTLISMLKLPLEISPQIGLDPFFAGELLMDDWEDYGVQWFAYAYLGADSFFAVAYTLFFVGLAFRLTPRDLTNGWDRFFAAALAVSTLILFAADELENVAGLFAMSRDVWALSWPTSIKRLFMLLSLAALAPLLFRWF